ncbi:hypothetical protein L873DRAFT_1848313 [Choiromyces venosus 120613-1]|uniref:Uncharacterized protein n=1 Tax=Choiromyces venosus 120613-1 TaxID=1336337 RepID=A0A3N4J2U5_9PEZI|nr:hypothetical protein L873DRAFT_1848313 [Choiromyces venosus 120613-1]
MYIQSISHLDLVDQDKRSLSEDALPSIIYPLLSTILLNIGPKASNFCKLLLLAMIPLILLSCMENSFADMSLPRPYYSWEITRRFNYIQGFFKAIAWKVEEVNAINSKHAQFFLERVGNAMNKVRTLKDMCMGRTLAYSKGYKDMGVLMKELREIEVEVNLYVEEVKAFKAEASEVTLEGEKGRVDLGGGRFSHLSLNSPARRRPHPPILQQPARDSANIRTRNIGGGTRAQGLSRTNAIPVVRRTPVPRRALLESRRRAAYTTNILSPKPNRTMLLGASNSLLDVTDGKKARFSS